MKNQRVLFTTDDEQKAFLLKKAAEQDRTMSWIIRSLIAKEMEKENAETAE